MNIEPRYNIAQTTMIEVVVPHQAGHTLRSMRWGLILPC
jgi:putative SOS response-associated peptidase YedK